MSEENIGGLSAQLERAALVAILRTYEDLNGTYFRFRLRAPAFRLVDARARLGAYLPQPRGIELSRSLLAEHGWGVLVEVLKHEMAHQFVFEVLDIHDEGPHGATFRKVCAERGIDAGSAGVPEPGESPAIAPALERVARLLALAESSNQNEAENAMRAAQRLMLKYNLSQAEAQVEQRYGFRHLGKPTGRTSEAERLVAAILGEYFFVEVIWVPVWRSHEGKRGSVLEICGSPENLELAEYVYGFLLTTAERLWKQFKKAQGLKRNRDRRSYIAGVMSGFREKLEAERSAQSQQGLVWVGDPRLGSWFRGRHPSMRTTRYRGSGGTDAHARGKEAGRNIVLRRGVSGAESAGRPRLLGSGR